MVRRFARVLLPSPADLFFIGTVLLVLWLGGLISNRDGDLGWHIALGRVILSTGTIPTSDLLSYTIQGQPFVPHEWFAEVIFAAAYQLGGFDGVALVTASVIGATFAGLVWVMLRRGLSPLIVAPLVLLGLLVSIAHWAARPHIFTFLFTLVWATALEEHRRLGSGRLMRGLRWLPLVMLLWVNVHGGFIIGDMLTVIYLVGAVLSWLGGSATERLGFAAQVRDLMVLLVISLVLVGVNPVGFALLGYADNFLRQSYLRATIPELHSPDFHNPLFWPMLVLISLALVFSVRREPTPLLLLPFWAAASLFSFRNLPQFVIVCLPLVGQSAQDVVFGDFVAYLRRAGAPLWMPWVAKRVRAFDARLRSDIALVAGGVPSLVVLLAVVLLFARGVRLDLWQEGYGFSASSFPVAAIQQLQPFPPGKRVFNDAQWGGYLSFCCQSHIATFVDGRVDTFGADYFRDYQRVLDAAPGWQDVLDRYQVDWVLVSADRPIARWLDRDASWRCVYADRTAVVFVRHKA